MANISKLMGVDVGGSYDSGCRVYRNAAQSIPGSTFTKIQFNTEDYDNLSEYDNTTNYRFTAQAAGIYMVSSTVKLEVFPADTRLLLEIRKNNTSYARGSDYSTSIQAGVALHVSVPVKLATNDYVEIWIYQFAGAKNTDTLIDTVYMIVQRIS